MTLPRSPEESKPEQKQGHRQTLPQEEIRKLSESLYGYLEPILLEIDQHVNTTVTNQNRLSLQIDALSRELDRIPSLDPVPLVEYQPKMENVCARADNIKKMLDIIVRRVNRLHKLATQNGAT